MEPDEYHRLRALEADYWWHANLRRTTLGMLRKYARLRPASAILDVGCGAGGLLACLRREIENTQSFGVDLHPLAVAIAQTRVAGGLCRASANALPFGDARFEALLSLDVFCAREVDEAKALAEAHRVLRPGGILVINLPAFEFLGGEHDLVGHTRHRYTARELGTMLREARFSILRLTYWNAVLFPVVLARRQWQRRLSRSGPPHSDMTPLPTLLNAFLKNLLGMESTVLSRVDLPFGSSVFAVARKGAG